MQSIRADGRHRVPPALAYPHSLASERSCIIYEKEKNCKVIILDAVCAVQIKDGLIAAVKAINGDASRANLTHAAFLLTGLTKILDYGDLVVSPGLIDTHVHMNQPGRSYWEGEHTQLLALTAKHRYITAPVTV